ncbi:transcriptional regulator ATRX homolog [Ptychodera flava]|uniref:transcriptional regulator ATRX homolog n=1 Tax=Ptychodera flava TaxID=63121 RepID=UPI003969E3B8
MAGKLHGPCGLAREFLSESVRYCLHQLYSAKFRVSGTQLTPFIVVINEIKKEYADNPDVFTHLIDLLYQLDTDTFEGQMKYALIKKRIQYLLKEQTILADNLLYVIHETFDLKSGIMTLYPESLGLLDDERRRTADMILNTVTRSHSVLKQQNQPVPFYNYCKPAVSTYLASCGVPQKFTAAVSCAQSNPLTSVVSLPCTQSALAAKNNLTDGLMTQSVEKVLFAPNEFVKSRQLYDKTPLSLHAPNQVEILGCTNSLTENMEDCMDNKTQVDQVQSNRTSIVHLKEQREELTKKLKDLLKRKESSRNEQVDDDIKPQSKKSEVKQKTSKKPQTRSATRKRSHEEEVKSIKSQAEKHRENQMTNYNSNKRKVNNNNQESCVSSDTGMSEFTIKTLNKSFPYAQRVTIADGQIHNMTCESKKNDYEAMEDDQTSLSLYGITRPSPLACLHRMVSDKPAETCMDVPVDYSFGKRMKTENQEVSDTSLSGEGSDTPHSSSAQLSDNSEYDCLIFQAGGTSDHSGIESSSGDDEYQAPENSFQKLLIDNARPEKSEMQPKSSSSRNTSRRKHKKRKLH